jgi:putative FmdB family regulatory protein
VVICKGEKRSIVPVYEYVCQSCQHRFEAKQKMSDAPLSSCPRCGQPVSKVISASAIMFKGGGWYVTDYSDKMKPPAEAKPAETAKEGNGKPEQKPATTSPAPASSGTSEKASESSSETGSGGGATPTGTSSPGSSSSTPSSSTPSS